MEQESDDFLLVYFSSQSYQNEAHRQSKASLVWGAAINENVLRVTYRVSVYIHAPLLK